MKIIALIVGVLLTAATLGLPAGAHAQGNGAADVDAAFKHAFITGDLDGLFDLMAPDILAIEPFGTFTSRSALRDGFLAFIAANPGLTVTFSESAVVRNTSVHRAFASSEPIRGAGVARIVVIHTLVIAGGAIVAFTALPDLSDAETARFVMLTAGR